MLLRSMGVATIFLLGILNFTVLPSIAQQPAAGNKAVQITGLVGVKANTSGNLTLQNGNLQFASSGAKVSVPIHSVEDVVTENNTQRVFRGTLGTLTMFAPYRGPRFLGLFPPKTHPPPLPYPHPPPAFHSPTLTL